MKKIIYPLLALAAVGALISGMLLLQHYYPEAKFGIISCGQGIVNPCLSLAQSGYATVFGIPIAAFGLFWYLLAVFILLIADYAEGRYGAYALLLMLPLSGAAVASDVVLAGILIKLGILCPFCVATYAVSIGMLALTVLWYRKAVKEEQFSIGAALRDIFSTTGIAPDRKAFYSTFVLFLFLLAFAIFSTSYILRIKTGSVPVPQDKATNFLANFYRLPVEHIDFPATGIVLGNPNAKVTIYAFTDFLCSACNQFYKEEKVLFAKFRDRIKTVYYNYPLDQACNPEMKKTVYTNSCIAARAFLAASDAGILEDFTTAHFAEYDTIHTRYTAATPLSTLAKINISALKGMDRNKFNALMASESASRRVREHIGLSKKLGINATPTLFIGGRKIVGVPPVELLDQIIQNEIDGTKPSQ